MDDLSDVCIAATPLPGKSGDGRSYHVITLVTNKRVRVFASRELAKIATEVILFYERKRDIRLLGFIVMPDHIHMICEPARDLYHVIRDIKKLLSHMLIGHLSVAGKDILHRIEAPGSGKKKPLFELWQKDDHDSRIITENELMETLQYMYEHPVRYGICHTAFEYEFSDLQRYLV